MDSIVQGLGFSGSGFQVLRFRDLRRDARV